MNVSTLRRFAVVFFVIQLVLVPAVSCAEQRETLEIESWVIDVSSFHGLPAELLDHAKETMAQAILEANAPQPMRPRYVVANSTRKGSVAEFPHDLQVRKQGLEPVSVLLFPALKDLQSIVANSKANDMLDASFKKVDREVGRTLYYRVGPDSEKYSASLPVPWGTKFRGSIVQGESWRLLTKKVYRSFVPMDPMPKSVAGLRLGSPTGAVELGRVIAVPLVPENPRLRLVKLFRSGEDRSWIAFAMCDANAAKRGPLLSADGTSGFTCPIQAPHNPKVDQHSMLRIPRPLHHKNRTPGAEEELALDQWYAEHQQKVWMLRRTTDSTPFRESYIVSSINKHESLPIEALVVFADATVEQMIRGLKAVSAAR